MPVSRSTAPSRRGPLSLSSFCTKRSRTRGASAPTRAMSPGPKVSANPSLERIVNVRVRAARSSGRGCGRRPATRCWSGPDAASTGRSTASASCTTWPTRSRRSSARGVGTRRRGRRHGGRRGGRCPDAADCRHELGGLHGPRVATSPSPTNSSDRRLALRVATSPLAHPRSGSSGATRPFGRWAAGGRSATRPAA